MYGVETRIKTRTKTKTKQTRLLDVIEKGQCLLEEKKTGEWIYLRIEVTAAWFAGCAYAVGVVAEFFRTGGMDGLGVTGL